jgi:NAD(P)-dependent dehydrogenase (short-subunit alcohol dehydrogenase family)
MGRFSDKCVLVTGATAGIGRATAEAFAREGAALIVTGRNPQTGRVLLDALHKLGARAEFIEGDVAQEDSARRWVAAALEHFGRLDVAVNNAGTEGRVGPLTERTATDYTAVFDTNVRGMLYALKHQIPAMARGGGGAIVNLSSIAGEIGMPGASLYVASKHAVNGLTRTAALEAAAQKVRVNAVAPGVIQTDMMQRFTGGDREAQAGLAQAHPIGRIGQPQEVAGSILFLASDDARFITGSVLTIDGGYTTQ